MLNSILKKHAPKFYDEDTIVGFKSMEEALQAKVSIENESKLANLDVSVTFCVVKTKTSGIRSTSVQFFGENDCEKRGLNVLARMYDLIGGDESIITRELVEDMEYFKDEWTRIFEKTEANYFFVAADANPEYAEKYPDYAVYFSTDDESFELALSIWDSTFYDDDDEDNEEDEED